MSGERNNFLNNQAPIPLINKKDVQPLVSIIVPVYNAEKYLDLSGSQNPKKSFNNCCLAACTVAIKNGRIATCSFVFNLHHFNRYFNEYIQITEMDSIDIYKAQSMQKIVDFVNHSIPLCRHCKSLGEDIIGNWRKTEYKITEWT